jgi:hypothetical protein
MYLPKKSNAWKSKFLSERKRIAGQKAPNTGSGGSTSERNRWEGGALARVPPMRRARFWVPSRND